MMAAIKAVETLSAAGVRNPGDRLVLYDKNPVLGRKIYLTGRGRCNITNTRPWEEFSQHIYPNKSFLKHAFNAFSNEDVMRFFNERFVRMQRPRIEIPDQRCGEDPVLKDSLMDLAEMKPLNRFTSEYGYFRRLVGADEAKGK